MGFMDKNEIIKRLNCLIDTAVGHGGDAGGAYLSAPDRLFSVCYRLLETLRLDQEIVVKQVYITNCISMGWVSNIRFFAKDEWMDYGDIFVEPDDII